MSTAVINIDTDAKCKRCGGMGTLPSGFCMSCISKGVKAGAFDDVIKKAKQAVVNKGGSMIIKKVKLSDDLNKIEFMEMKNGVENKFTMECSDAPVSEFRAAFNQLAKEVPEIIEAPESWGKDLTVLGVSVTYDKNDNKTIIGAVITVKRSLENNDSPMVINTPYKAYENEFAEEKQMPGSTQRAISAILDFAKSYIEGVRAQGKLEF